VFRRSAAPPLAGAYAALAVLVAAGRLTGVDGWAVVHLMPGWHGPGAPPTLLDGLVPLYDASWDGAWDAAANVVTLPAQALVASLVVATCCALLWRRGRKRTALAWAAAWVAGNLVELLCKSVLARPLLHRHGVPLPAFDSSFPSGHTLRSVLLAATVSVVAPGSRRWVAAWAAASIALLDLDGVHVPSDIAGGLLLAGLAIVVAASAEERTAATGS